MGPGAASSPAPTICVFGAAPLLTVTAERGTGGRDADVHVHAGGQGFWIARMAAALGERVVLCSPAGGETGFVFEQIAGRAGLEVDAVPIEGQTAAYVHDRRSGERVEVAHSGYPALSRHELDALYGRTIERSLEAGLCVLAGYPATESVPTDTFRRLAADLRAQGVPVVADLAGDVLAAALEGGLALLKLSHEEAIAGGHARSDDVGELARAAAGLAARGAEGVVITCAERPTVAHLEGRTYLAETPPIEPVDPRGAGDAATAALAVAMRRGLADVDALRLACAAGAATVARHGLASAEPGLVDALAEGVRVTVLQAAAAPADGAG